MFCQKTVSPPETSPMPKPPISYEYGAFVVLPAKTVIGANPLNFVFGIPKAFIEEFREQHPEYEKADSSVVASRIFDLKQNEITLRLPNVEPVAPGFEIRPLTIDSFKLPATLPEPKFEISNGRIPIWDNRDLGAILRSS
jgi:hypothetical protein